MKIKLHRYFLYGLLVGIAFVFRHLPLELASKCGGWLGRICYFLLRHEREKALTHLKWVFDKEKSLAEIEQLAKNTFVNLGRNLGEWLKMPALTSGQILARVEVENLERVQEALKKGKGLILLTGHFGNWEWLAAYFGCLGYSGGVLGKRIYFEPYNRLIVSLRRSHRVETIYQDESPKRILKLLAQNFSLGILPDQDVEKINGIFIPFLGREAYTPTAPVALALASRAALVPVFMVRQKKNKFKMIVEEPIRVERTGNKEADLRRYTLEWNTVLERYIRKYPDHWVWIHRRWKTRNKAVKGV